MMMSREMKIIYFFFIKKKKKKKSRDSHSWFFIAIIFQAVQLQSLPSGIQTGKRESRSLSCHFT